MNKVVLFSTPTESNRETLLKLIFPDEMGAKVLAYMPSDGANCPQQFIDEWKEYAKRHRAEFRYVDNSKEDAVEEVRKVKNANILVITGGNTYTLLFNLKKSGLDTAIKEFTKKEEFILAGFSAGALVLTPTIKICSLPGFDENLVGLPDLTGLSVVDFEVFPHYDESLHKEVFEKYQKTATNEVKKITNEEYLLVDL